MWRIKFGTGADYTYLVPLKGPEQTVEGGFIYFEDKFGVEQVASEYGWLDFKYVEAKDLDETMMSTANDAMKAAKGLTHVVFDETLASTTPEAGIVVQNPALTSTGDYAYMYFDVYNAGDKVIPLQLAWSGASRALAPHAWTRVVIELAFVNDGLAVNVSSTDLVGLTLYLAGGGADNYDQEDLEAADIDLYFRQHLFRRRRNAVPSFRIRNTGRSGILFQYPRRRRSDRLQVGHYRCDGKRAL